MNKYMNKLLVCSLGALAIFLAGCEKQEQARQELVMPVTVKTLKKEDLPITLYFNGQTTSDLDVIVRAKVGGTIEKQLYKPGQAVNSGDVLYQIDEAKYKAAYESAKGNYQAAVSAQRKASADFARAKSLQAKNAIAQKDFDAALAAVNGAIAQTRAAEANMKNAQIDLGYSKVIAPFDGVVGDTRKDAGSLVNVGDELVRLSKLNPMYVKFGISDVSRLDIDNNLANGAWAKLNSTVSININGVEHNGTLVFMDNVIDPNTAAVDAKAILDNKNHAIRPGTYTQVIVRGFYAKNSFLIPQKSVSQDVKGSFVYIYNNGIVDKRHVKIASEEGEGYVINEGLKDGDMLILDNFKKIAPGAKVQIINPKSMPADNNATSK